MVGKSEPITTYDLLGVKGQTDEVLMGLKESFHKALVAYKSKQWDEAIKLFEESLEFEYKRFPELRGQQTNPSLVYIDRCKDFKENPPR